MVLKYPPITSKLWLGTFWVDIYLDWYGVCETCLPKNLCLMVSVLGLPMLNPTIGYFGGSGVYALATLFLHLHIPFLHLHICMQWQQLLLRSLFFSRGSSINYIFRDWWHQWRWWGFNILSITDIILSEEGVMYQTWTMT